MPPIRNAEVIRQWKILRTIDAHRHGRTVKDLAADTGVTPRTIWRDMAALQEVGFPLTSDVDGKQTRWMLIGAPWRGLTELGISTTELCALYMGRRLAENMAGAPFGAAMAAVCRRIEAALPPKLRVFLDMLPALVETTPGAVKKPGTKKYEEHVGRLIEAAADQAVCAMTYFSASRGSTREYVVHPYRVTHAHGGLYLLAWVPEYAEIRTFAMERIQKLSRREERFTRQAELSADAFGNSLGVNRGKPTTVVLSFTPGIAIYVRERVWHKSQVLEDLPDGRIRMTLNVCADAALRTWVLGFGAHARIESPSWLAEEILEQLDAAREAYVPRLDIALSHRLFAIDHPQLPGLRRPRAN